MKDWVKPGYELNVKEYLEDQKRLLKVDLNITKDSITNDLRFAEISYKVITSLSKVIENKTKKKETKEEERARKKKEKMAKEEKEKIEEEIDQESFKNFIATLKKN